MTWTHKTSMEIFAKAVTEDLITGERQVCATAFLTFVAIDEDGRPSPVPAVYPETEQEKLLHEGAPKRAEERRERRKQSKGFADMFGTGYPWSR